MTAFAVIRPDEWNLPLFLHLLAAMALVGALVVAAAYLGAAWRGDGPRALTAGFRSLLYAGLPAFIVNRATAEWLVREQGLVDGDPPTWVAMGFMVTDGGFLLLLIALVASGLAVRRARRPEPRGGTGAVRLATVMTSILLVGYLVMVWAMTAKPG